MNKFYVSIGFLLSIVMCSHVTFSRETPVDRTLFIVDEPEDDQDALAPIDNIGVAVQELFAILADQVPVQADPEDTDVAFNFAMRGNPQNEHLDRVN